MDILVESAYLNFTESTISEFKNVLFSKLYECFEIEKSSNDRFYFNMQTQPSEKINFKIIIANKKLCTNSSKGLIRFEKEAFCLLKKYDSHFKKENLQIILTPSIIFPEKIEQKKTQNSEVNEEFDYEKKSKQFIPENPLYTFDRVILAEETKQKIIDSLSILECEQKVFNDWGLCEIQPHPSSCLSFYGPSGTGKTMAAEAVAQKIGKKILKVSYADVESKFVGEGPKMVKAIFLAAAKNDAVLFFDEADSLLSKRLTNVSNGSDQAINSMRSQILICLEEFQGIVIFATNLIVNYDKAFLTRLTSIEFQIPDKESRKKIWDVHLKPRNDEKPHKLNIPLGEDVNISVLAENYEFVGREIRNAVVKACVKAAMKKKDIVNQSDFIEACNIISKEKEDLIKNEDCINEKLSTL